MIHIWFASLPVWLMLSIETAAVWLCSINRLFILKAAANRTTLGESEAGV